MSYRILVTGSRYWEDVDLLENVLTQHLNYHNGFTIVHGACPTGADKIAADWAKRKGDYGVREESHAADWEQGKSAGPARNQKMVDLGANICHAFLLPNSKGTVDCVKRARRAKIIVVEHHG